jgi:hypothetical protein
MKYFNKILLLAGFAVMFASQAFAQYPSDFSKDQADSTISFRRSEISGMTADLTTQSDALRQANADLQQRIVDNSKCREDLFSMLGSDRNGYNAYRERLARAEQELSALRALPADQLAQNIARVSALETEIRALRDDKLVLIPDHMTRVSALSSNFMQMKHGMVPTNNMYTVGTWRENRDCLWNIAKKPEIYNDPFAWPKIWRANMDQIHNPDIIHPGQQLQIVKTEITPADRDLTGYHHRGRH